MSEHLKSLGATLPFDGHNADFGGICSKMFLSDVVHQALIEVDEKGTEAAAATVVFMTDGMKPKYIEFFCQRPFLFVIHEKIYNNIIFYGKLVKPN